MPKIKRSLESTRSRRQASNKALKQMQLYLEDDDDETNAIPEDKDDKDVVLEDLIKTKSSDVPATDQPPKKKYKLSHRKSSDDRDVIVLKSINSNYTPKEETLELECYVEELSEVQLERRRKYEIESEELEKKLEKLVEENNAEIVHRGEFNAAYELDDMIGGNKSNVGREKVDGNQSVVPFQLVLDPRLGIIVGTMQQGSTITPTTAKTTTTTTTTLRSKNKIQTNTQTKGIRPKRNAASAPNTPVQSRTTSLLKSSQNAKNSTLAPMHTRNNNIKVVQPVKRSSSAIQFDKTNVVDLTSDEANQSDNKEVSFSKIQGKTYPSLVVAARPHLRAVDSSASRADLDLKVKKVLTHPPTKFTEWLIQMGLVRSEQRCSVHTGTPLKLGMYSDASKFQHSGGYVWISDCCPSRFLSVYTGSIFDGSSSPPTTIVKLIYHWSCLTTVQNVLQWVKVDNLFVKGIYTWLRAVCTLSNQTHIRQLGGLGVKVEIGVISLGTTSQDGNQRQVKVEVLGVLETTTKYVRLRAVEPMTDAERNPRRKFSRILEPILQWVHPSSTIVTDLTVDRFTLNQMGFMNVVQTTSQEYISSNRTIMEYLRRIVPRMFQNTLSLLSRQIIQQFLDELVWREWFGTSAAQAFDKIVEHLAEQTRNSSATSLIIRLNRVSANPFRSWIGGPIPPRPCTNHQKPNEVQTEVRNEARPPPRVYRPSRKSTNSSTSSTNSSNSIQQSSVKSISSDIHEQMVPLENYYYGTIDSVKPIRAHKVVMNLKCPLCKNICENNTSLQMHLFKHAHNLSDDAQICRYCLTSFLNANELKLHVSSKHHDETRFASLFVCLICETIYKNPFELGKHMSKEHSPSELPYECGSCAFRCSNHKQVIDHFYARHDGDVFVQCPFCLKLTVVRANARNVPQNVLNFVQHLQQHQKKHSVKKCGKCTLWFVQKDLLKEHQQKMHISMRGRQGLVPHPSTRKVVLVPKSKIDKNPCDAKIINFSSLYYDSLTGSVCKECDRAVTSPKHFPSFESCTNSNCNYSTCCANAMASHLVKCKGLYVDVPEDKLPFEMFCVCGHRNSDGNSMAKHLAICEKKSAYPSENEAKSASVVHSMLDILGLVRKPEEATVSLDKARESDKESSETEEAVVEKGDETAAESEDKEFMSSENVEGLHEAALNDILASSSDSVAPMDVDIDTVIGGIDSEQIEIE